MDPHVLEKLAARLAFGVVVVAGTNGKTTTARILAEVLAADGRHVVHNRAGANLVGGIVSTLTADSSADGRKFGIAVLEADEAALPEVIARTSPRVIVLTNLFRDQLDRYGEVDLILDLWREALEHVEPTTTLVVNADDPALVALTDGLAAGRLHFGIRDSFHQRATLPDSAEVICCARCGNPLAYRAIYVGHLGDWYCPTCGIARPALDVAGGAIELGSYESQSLKVTVTGGPDRVEVGLPGLYNSYNVIAALTAAQLLGVSGSVSRPALARYRGAFGRAERVLHRGRSLLILLVKNPVGCDEVLRTMCTVDSPLSSAVLLGLNDAASDGRDVSWIWDVDFEQLAASDIDFYCAGSRWADMRNRLYYAGVRLHRIHALGADLEKAVDDFADALPENGSGFVLPTYSAMLAIRERLAKAHHLSAFWDE